MTRRTLKPQPRTEIAAAIFAGALALYAFTQIPARTAPEAASTLAAPVVVPVAVAVASAPESLRSASYYPEHLAALQSLSGFQPMANAGDKSAPRANLGPGGKAVFDPKAPRRADAQSAQAKTAAAPQPGPVAQAAAQTAAAPPPPAAESPARIFGMPVPGPAELGAQMSAQAANWRDTAGRWGAAASGLGEKVADLWRR